MNDVSLVYVGTYTTSKTPGKGIYLLRLDTKSGRLTAEGLVAQSTNPSFLAVHPGRRFLYAVNEVAEFGGAPTGAVSAFSIDPTTGGLTPLNQASSGGKGPCYLTLDAAGKCVLVANYTGGSVAVLPIRPDGGLNEPSTVVQHKAPADAPKKRPHAHSIDLDGSQRHALVADLGLDRVFLYRFDPFAGTLAAGEPAFAALPAGSGPRHVAWHPSGRFLYAINELASSMTAFAYDSDRGALQSLRTISTLPEGFAGQSDCAEIQVHPSGRFLYGSNRGHDSIAIFAIDPQSGRLKILGHESTQGKTPRGFGIDPTGTFLLAANQDSGTILVFRIGANTGLLKYTGAAVEVPSPVCVTFLPH